MLLIGVESVMDCGVCDGLCGINDGLCGVGGATRVCGIRPDLCNIVYVP